MMKYMKELGNLFLKETAMFNLFITENIRRFMIEVESRKMQDTIFNVGLVEGKILMLG